MSAAGGDLGHAIAPGIDISLDALANRAARLMKIELADPAQSSAATAQSMQAGAVYGFAGQVDGMVARTARRDRRATHSRWRPVVCRL